VIFKDLQPSILRFRNTYATDTKEDDIGCGRAPTSEMLRDAALLSAASTRLRAPPKVVLSTWSPPPCLKASGRMRGGGNNSTLRCSRTGKPVVDKLGHWLADSISSYSDIGVHVDVLSVQNEPDHDPGGHEGCTYGDEREYERAVLATRKALEKLPSPPLLLGPEHTKVNGWLPSGVLLSTLDVVGQHMYHGDEPEDSVTRAIAETGKWSRKNQRDVWLTETANLAVCEREDPIRLATRIHNCFTVGSMSAFLVWDIFWGAGTGEGMLVLVDNPFTGSRDKWSSERGFTILPNFWFYAQFCRFIRPGALRVHVDSSSRTVLASAYVQSRDRFCVILINTSRASVANVSILAGQTCVAGSSQVFQSTLDTSMTNLGQLQNGAIASLPPQSITTVVIGAE
jgi:O-glycosyl hydrolase